MIYNSHKLENKCRENHEGEIEYKFKLIKNTRIKMNRLTTQMLYRFIQGEGVAEYYLGIMDDGKVIGMNEGELYSTLNAILDCLYKLGGYYTQITIYNNIFDVNEIKLEGFKSREVKYCIHLKIKIDKLPTSEIEL